MLEDHLKDGTGGLAELNTILDSTQTKINRLKVGRQVIHLICAYLFMNYIIIVTVGD